MGTELQGAELAACKILASKQASEKIDNRPQVAIHGRLEELHFGGDAAVQRLPESLRAIPNPLPVLSGPRLKKNLSYSFNLTSVYLVPHG